MLFHKNYTMMRILLIILFFSVCHIASSQATKEDSIRTEIGKLSYEWNQALVKRDSTTLDRILANDFTLSSASGSPLPRKEWMYNSLHGLLTDTAEFVGPL